MHSSWRQAIKADAGLGTMDDIVSIGDLGDHGKALDKSERDQVAAGADPADIKAPHMKRREYIKAAKRKKEREARKKARAEFEKATAASAPATSGDVPMSIDTNLLEEILNNK